MQTEIQRNRMRLERDTPWNNLTISPFPWPNDPLPILSSLDREREERRVDFIVINLQYDWRIVRSRATPHFMILLFRELRRTEILSSRFPIIPSPRERPFTNSHDFTKPIVRSDDGEAYRQ